MYITTSYNLCSICIRNTKKLKLIPLLCTQMVLVTKSGVQHPYPTSIKTCEILILDTQMVSKKCVILIINIQMISKKDDTKPTLVVTPWVQNFALDQ